MFGESENPMRAMTSAAAARAMMQEEEERPQRTSLREFLNEQ